MASPAFPKVAAIRVGGDAHIAVGAAGDRPCAATSSSLTASPAPRKPAPMMRIEIARLQPAGAEALRQREQIVGAERRFQFGERAERQHQRAPRAADLGFDLAAVTIGHAQSDQAAANVSAPADSSARS